MQRNVSMPSMLRGNSRQFAPLRRDRDLQKKGVQELQGIVFDVDGTLCLPQAYMFAEMRSALGISNKTDILEHCHSLPPTEQAEAMQKIRHVESGAMLSQKPQPGLLPLMEYLEKMAIPKAIWTRNFDAPVTHLIQKFIPNITFAPIVTRSFRPPKPDPAGILHIAKAWGFMRKNESGEMIADASNLIMVGDSLDDMTGGSLAGAVTVLLVNDSNVHLKSHEHCNLVINSLDELIEILEKGFETRVRNEEELGD